MFLRSLTRSWPAARCPPALELRATRPSVVLTKAGMSQLAPIPSSGIPHAFGDQGPPLPSELLGWAQLRV